jgi:integrase
VKLSVPGVYAAPRTLADKSVRIYYYHRATGVRLPDDPASRAFLERVLRLDEMIEGDPQGGKAAARALFPGRKTPQSLRAVHRSPPHPAPAPAPADRSGTTVKPKLPDGCFKLLFDRFKMSTEFTDLAESTRKEYARHMQHLEPALGFHPVSALSADLFDKLIAKFNEHPTLQKAIRRTMSVLLGYAMRILKWIPANPLLGVQKIKRRGRQEAGARMPLSEPAIARFRRANPYGSRARLVFELALITALRRADLARVPAEDIEAGEIILRTGKSGIPVVARATEHLVLALRAFRANHPEHAGAFYALGAQKDGQPIHKRTISADFAEAAKQAAFSPQERLHALRYTAATRLCELGLHYEDIAEVTGHAMASMARHYCRRRARAVENAERLKAYGEQPHHGETLLTLDGTVPMETEAVADPSLAASRKTADAAPSAGARLDQSRNGLLEDGRGRAIGARQQVRAGRKRSGDGTCARTTARAAGRLVAAAPGRPFADDAQRARKPLTAQPPPEFGPVAAAGRPLGVEPIEPRLERARARAELLGAAAPNDVAPHLARATGATEDLLYGDAVLVQRQHGRISLGAATPSLMLKALR